MEMQWLGGIWENMPATTQHEVIVALIAAITTITAGYLTYKVGKYQIVARAKTDAAAAVDARWTALCDQQQERITQMHGDMTAMTKVVGDLQRELTNSAVDRLDMHAQMQELETQAIERERRVRAVEAQVAAKDARIAELECRVTELETESARKDEVIARLKAELARISGANQVDDKRKAE